MLAGHMPAAAAAPSQPLPYPEMHRRSLALLSSASDPTLEPWRSAPALHLSTEQQAFFTTFGYLRLPGLLADRASQVATAFEQVWARYGGGQNGQVRGAPHRPVSPCASIGHGQRLN